MSKQQRISDFLEQVSQIEDAYCQKGSLTGVETEGMITMLCRRWFEDTDTCCKDKGLMIGSCCVICDDCGGTGVIETGNNDLPCKCQAGDLAMFNVAGRSQPVQGHILKSEHRRRLGSG